MEQYIVTAPNGKEVTIGLGGYSDRTFSHRQVVEDDGTLNQTYPNIFRRYISAQPQKQMLTEVPEVGGVAPEDDKPTVISQDQIIEKVETNDDNMITEVPLEEKTNKELQVMCNDQKIEVSKSANKAELIEALTK